MPACLKCHLLCIKMLKRGPYSLYTIFLITLVILESETLSGSKSSKGLNFELNASCRRKTDGWLIFLNCSWLEFELFIIQLEIKTLWTFRIYPTSSEVPTIIIDLLLPFQVDSSGQVLSTRQFKKLLAVSSTPIMGHFSGYEWYCVTESDKYRIITEWELLNFNERPTMRLLAMLFICIRSMFSFVFMRLWKLFLTVGLILTVISLLGLYFEIANFNEALIWNSRPIPGL